MCKEKSVIELRLIVLTLSLILVILYLYVVNLSESSGSFILSWLDGLRGPRPPL